MCNLYSITTNQEAIRAFFRVVNRYVGNLAPMPGVFPDYPAPVVRNVDSGTEMTLMRWGMPPATANRRPADTSSAALARPAQTGEPLPGPGQQLRGVRARAEPGQRKRIL